MNLFTCLLALAFTIVSSTGYQDFSTYPKNYDKIKKGFLNDRPTIGILSMTNNDKGLFEGIPNTADTTYVSASYVKLVTGAGARGVALIADMPEKEIKRLLHSINGVILSGGDGEFGNSPYEKVARMAYHYSMEKYKKGEIWPILGICRGSQILPVLTAMSNFLVHTDSKNYSIPLTFSEDWKESRMFGQASEGVIETLRTKPITINAHIFSLPTNHFMDNHLLRDFYRVISTNKDREGIDFVSTFEARNYPMYALQWHPEKLLYVWNPMMVADHSLDSIRVAQYVANFFVSEARKNSNRFTSRTLEEKHLIHRWSPIYLGDIADAPYEQCYLFPINN